MITRPADLGPHSVLVQGENRPFRVFFRAGRPAWVEFDMPVSGTIGGEPGNYLPGSEGARAIAAAEAFLAQFRLPAVAA